MADIINFLDHRKDSKYGRNPQEPRAPIPKGVVSTTLQIDDGKEISGEIVNISAGGLALLVDSVEYDLERGSEIEKITINTPDGDIFETNGYITHVTPEIKDEEFAHRVGLGFKRKESPTLEKLVISKVDRQFDILKTDAEMIQIMEDLIIVGEDTKINVKLDANTFIDGSFRRHSQLKKMASFSIDFESEEHCINFDIEKEITCFFKLFNSFYLFRTKVLRNIGKSISSKENFLPKEKKKLKDDR